MPFSNTVIFLKDRKTGVFKLRDDIKSFGFDEKQGQYYVIFKKGDNILYYNPCNVDIAKCVRQLEPPFRVIRVKDGYEFHHILGVNYCEGQYNRAYRIIFEKGGECKNYITRDLHIEEHIDDYRSINVWEYLREVAKYNIIPTEDDNSLSLADKYAKMEFVSKNSLLETYLNTTTYRNLRSNKGTPIFPFGCNRSQYKAVKSALENSISVIQGPPGTGKTQTILNIMANLLLDRKTMQIVSNNNSAVENVKEKLEATGLGFICAQLGRNDNKKSFLDNQLKSIPDLSGWQINDEDEAIGNVYKLSAELSSLYSCQEDYSTSLEQLKEFQHQLSLLPYREHTVIDISKARIKYLLSKCRKDLENRCRLSLITRIRLFLNHLPTSPCAVDALEYYYLYHKIDEIKTRCESYRTKIQGIEEKNHQLQELSMKVLKNHLYKVYGSSKNDRKAFNADDLYRKSREFLSEYPIVLSTTFSATSNIHHSTRFDYLIMDEASQIDIAAGALALSCANNVVVVGDDKQLPNVVDNHTKEIVDAVFSKYELAEAYRYSTNSFLSSVCALFPDVPRTLLREHYRCDPLIIGFCSKQFYNGELIPMKAAGESDFAPIRVVRTVKGNHARGTVNRRQVEVIMQEILPALEEQFTDIGIIAPYNNQVYALQEAIQASGRNYVAATVHKFQGREDDAIVLSTVDNQIKEFTNDPHLLNVAVSRAKKQFTLVVSADEQPDSNIKSLIDYIEYYQGGIEQSEISSIFDLLYEDYTKELLDFYKTHERVSEYDSENLTYWAIQNTIKEKGFPHLGILMHYPLRHLITAASNLTPEQRAYASRSWTHVDFLVYDTVTHKAKLAVEVDGTQYHKSGSDQGRRDLMKDSVLAAIGLPLLRLSTAGSMEKERIAKALAGIQM